MRTFVVSLVVLCLVAVGSGTALAAAGLPNAAANEYPNGAEGFWMGAAPPPGIYYINYDMFYNADRVNGPNGGALPVPVSVNVFAQVSRLLYMSNYKIFGGNWGAQVFVVFADARMGIGPVAQRASGLSDVIVDPFIMSWHWPNFHVTTGVDVYLPTGVYQAGRFVNLSANAFVYEPIVAFTYMTPIKGVTTSAKFMYDIPQVNTDYGVPMGGPVGHLKYGQEFHFDYSVDYSFNENWKAGIEGYYYQQTTDNKFNGVAIPLARGEALAVGPGVEYSKGKVMVSWRTEWEVMAKNRPEGIVNWLRLVIVF